MSVPASRLIESSVPIDLRSVFGAYRTGRDPSVHIDRFGAWRATRTPEGPATVCVEPRGASGHRFAARAWGPGADWAIDRSPDLVGASDHAATFAPADPAIAELWRRHRGVRFGATHTIVESLLPVIVEQKVTTVEARRSWNALVRRFSEPAPAPAHADVDLASRFRLRLRPRPDRVGELHYPDLHRIGIERRRAEVLLFVARRAGTIERLASSSLADARRALESIPGIGPWTTSSTLQQTYGDPDVVIVGDYHLPNFVTWNLAGEPRGDDARMLELLEPYRGDRARVVRLLAFGGHRAPAFGPKKRLRSIAAI